MQLLEPWVFLRVIAGIAATALILRASLTAITVLRRFDVMQTTEGQLALERRVELAGTFVRASTAAQVIALVLSVLAADKLSRGIRGAMCAYGTLSSSPWGFRALAMTIVAALAAGTVAQLFAFDAQVRGMELARTLAWATLALAPLCVIDLVLQIAFELDLDLGVVASCCSVQLDPIAAAKQAAATGPRVSLLLLASSVSATCVALAWVCARRPKRFQVVLVGAMAMLSIPLGIAAVVVWVAPYALELPQHHCPFCLLRSDAAGIGYPLFGAMFVGAVSLVGAGLTAVIAWAPNVHVVWRAFVTSRLRRGALAWVACAIVCAVPVVRYAIVSHGAALFP